MTTKPLLHPSNFTPEEWRLVKLLGKVGGEWPWYMTDEEYAIVGAALKRVEGDRSQGGSRDAE